MSTTREIAASIGTALSELETQRGIASGAAIPITTVKQALDVVDKRLKAIVSPSLEVDTCIVASQGTVR